MQISINWTNQRAQPWLESEAGTHLRPQMLTDRLSGEYAEVSARLIGNDKAKKISDLVTVLYTHFRWLHCGVSHRKNRSRDRQIRVFQSRFNVLSWKTVHQDMKTQRKGQHSVLSGVRNGSQIQTNLDAVLFPVTLFLVVVVVVVIAIVITI